MSASNNTPTCDELDALCRPHGKDYAVLLAVTNEPRRCIQLVTYGKDPAGVVEAHKLKEFLKDAIFEGDPPKSVVHESFIRDAAKNEQLVKDLVTALKGLVNRDLGYLNDTVAGGYIPGHAVKKARDAIVKAES